jgi:hypothetical protein
MKVVVPGHVYLLDELKTELRSGINKDKAELVFVSRVGENYPGNKDSFDGVTTQEVCRALIERAIYLNNQKFSWYTEASIWLFRMVIWMYEKRAANIHGHPFNFKLSEIEQYPTNDIDSHII